MDSTEDLSFTLNPSDSPTQQTLKPRDDEMESSPPLSTTSRSTNGSTKVLISFPLRFSSTAYKEIAALKLLSVDAKCHKPPRSTRESPEYAQEQTRLLEQQAVAAASLKSVRYAEMDPPLIVAPPNSVIWMKLIHSRWLLLQMKECFLELWDVVDRRTEGPLITCPAIRGAIDGAVIDLDDDPHCIKIHASTSSYVTYTFLLGLHIHCSCDPFTPHIDFWETTMGFSSILDQRGPLFLFSGSVGSVAKGFVKDMVQNSAVGLRRSEVKDTDASDSSSDSDLESFPDDSSCEINHEVLDMRVREDFVAVARNRTLDLYSTSQIISLLQGQSKVPTISDIPPFQALEYPGPGCPLFRASILREPNHLLSASPDAIILVSAEPNGCYGVVATPLQRRDTSSSPSAGTVFTSEPLSDRYFTTLSNTLASWRIPGELCDIPLLVDFDEKTGIAAAAMASGRVWVMDSTTWSNYDKTGDSMPPGLASESPETTKNLSDPNPEPFRWPRTIPLPAPFGTQPSSDKPREIAPGWSDEVDKYFPYKNQVEYYGSTPWFIQEVAHIPIRRSYQISEGIGSISDPAQQEGWAKTVLFTTDAAHPFSFSRGCYEVIEVHPLSGASNAEHGFWLLAVEVDSALKLYKLKPFQKVEAIVEHLRKPGSYIEQICEHRRLRAWCLDQERLKQLLAWRDRYFRNFGRPGKTLC
ncbi:hypothetical protein FRC04_011370 [Tulasnella sp. 424]|nr:hypothetical protein FRC04_011370 [Tulasnella sp. 424]